MRVADAEVDGTPECLHKSVTLLKLGDFGKNPEEWDIDKWCFHVCYEPQLDYSELFTTTEPWI